MRRGGLKLPFLSIGVLRFYRITTSPEGGFIAEIEMGYKKGYIRRYQLRDQELKVRSNLGRENLPTSLPRANTKYQTEALADERG